MNEKYTTYSKEWFQDSKINCTFEKAYFKNSNGQTFQSNRKPEKEIVGIKVTPTDRSVEEYAEKLLESGEVCLGAAAWKMGRLFSPDGVEVKVNLEHNENDNEIIKNGYGHRIDVNELKRYLEYLSDPETKLTALIEEYVNINDADPNKKYNDRFEILERIYSKMAQTDISKEERIVPKNFGSVYILAMLYFLSRGGIPIYDQFAHKAVKALYAKVNPNMIYVGSSPDKSDTKSVVKMLLEYIWLLEKVFGKSNIDRTIDRALWVYGHADEKFNGTLPPCDG